MQPENLKDLHPEISFKVITNIAVRTTAIAIVGATSIAVISILVLPPILIPLVAFICGWQIFFVSYQVTVSSTKYRVFLITGWNHLIMIISCLVGGLLAGSLYAGVCILPDWFSLEQIPHFLSNCNEFLIIEKRFVSASIICSILFLFLPGIQSYFYWCNKK